MGSDSFEIYMLQAIEAANKISSALTRPNPKVGAVLLSSSGEVVVAAHEKFGTSHAEVNLLENARKQNVSTQGATLFVTLEPCSHFGKTPPCVDAVIAAKFARVVIGTLDPNPLVNGRGIEKLKKAGIEVTVGVCEMECRDLNREWLLSQKIKRPFIRLKMATSMDGLWTAQNGKSQWITGPEARAFAARERSWAEVLMTSTQTVLKDNPRMTARERDKNSELQPQVRVLGQRQNFSLKDRALAEHPGGARFDRMEGSLGDYLQGLFEKESLTHALLEAGPTLTQIFLDKGYWDEIHHYMGPIYLGGEGLRLKALAAGDLPGIEGIPTGAQGFSDGTLLMKFRNPKTLT